MNKTTKSLSLLSLFIMLSISVFANGDSENISAGMKSMLPDGKHRVTVMPLAGEDKESILFVEDYLSALIDSSDNISILGRIDRELSLAESDLTAADSSGFHKIANFLAVDYYIKGSLSPNFDLDLSLVNSMNGSVIRQRKGTYTDLDDLLLRSPDQVADLFFEKPPAAVAGGSGKSETTVVRDRITGSGYYYKLRGVNYYYPSLVETMLKERPDSARMASLYDEYNTVIGIKLAVVLGGGASFFAGMAMWLPPVISGDDLEVLGWTGVALSAVGYVMILVGGLSEDELPVFQEMVRVYNQGL